MTAPSPPSEPCSCGKQVILAIYGGKPLELEAEAQPAGPFLLTLRAGALVAEQAVGTVPPERRRWVRHQCPDTFVAIDFETASHSRESACAMALVRVEGHTVTARKSWLIRPPHREFTNSHIHGIRWEDVARAPIFREVWLDARSFLAGAGWFAAHNAAFDRSVLRSCQSAAKIEPVKLGWVCTLKIARKVWQLPDNKLPTVADACGLELDHHDASSDALACALVLITAREKIGASWRLSDHLEAWS